VSESTTHVPHLERKLAKNIFTYDGEEEHKERLQRFCQEYGGEVEILKFNCYYDDPAYIQGLIYTLENNLCPNLRYLYMELYEFGHTHKFPLNLPLMPKLENIHFYFSSRELSKDYKVI
jgi:hypothetical protein